MVANDTSITGFRYTQCEKTTVAVFYRQQLALLVVFAGKSSF